MRINCPNCKHSYDISDNLIPSYGVLTNCSHCQSSFITLPEGLTILSNHTGVGDTESSGLPEDITTKLVVLNEGDTLQNGRFEVKSFLGKGKFGSVYKVFDKNVEMDMALRVRAIPDRKGPNASNQLMHGFKLWEKIKNTGHILTFYLPLLEEYKGLSLILFPMEFADGGSLRKWMDANPDPESRKNEAIEFFKQICLGVRDIHMVDLVHLGLKPDNILIVNGQVKISDFDLSRDLSNQKLIDPSMLWEGNRVAHYMAPEQIMAARPKDVDHRADIYALGCILFELLDGDPPYLGKPQEILDKHNRNIKPNSRNIEGSLSDIIFRCLETDPLDRLGDISELNKLLGVGFENEKATHSANDEMLKKLTTVFDRFQLYHDASRPEEHFFHKVQKWIKDALDLLEWGASVGNKEALFILGILYFNGDGIQEDKVEGLRLWKVSAEKGHGMAQYNLGLCYDKGEGVSKDKKEAVGWYLKAADQGITDAQKDLGNCYLYGEGVPEDKTEAVRWYRRASENGNAAAQCNIGYCYYKGTGVPADQVAAKKWLRKSAEQGYQDAIRLLDEINQATNNEIG